MGSLGFRASFVEVGPPRGPHHHTPCHEVVGCVVVSARRSDGPAPAGMSNHMSVEFLPGWQKTYSLHGRSFAASPTQTAAF